MSNPSNLSCRFLEFDLSGPLVLASGIIGTSAGLMTRAAHSGAAMVTAKSCGPAPRAGHPNPVAFDWDGGLLNAIGLTNPGAEAEVPLLIETRAQLAPLGVPLIATQPIQAVHDMALAGLLTWMWRRGTTPGITTATYFIVYGIGRGIIEIWRGDSSRGVYFGNLLSTSQLLSIGLASRCFSRRIKSDSSASRSVSCPHKTTSELKRPASTAATKT